MKRSRPLSLFLSVLFFIFLFPVVSLGASDNLINPDLTTWTDWSDVTSDVIPCTLTKGGNVYRVTVNSGSSTNYVGAVFDNSSLIAGHSYSLSFKMPSRAEVNDAFGTSYSSNVFENHFEKCIVGIGVGFLSASGDLDTPENMQLYQITKDNYTKFFGKTLKASFVASNYSGTPVVYIGLLPSDSSNHSFYFCDFKLVDNDDNSVELTGIKGFLHSIRWDLVGGTCEEEDCPHSSGDNPHLSLSERMSSGFASMFQTIGDKFEEGSTLNTWFNGLSDKVGSINGSLSGLGDRINGFFSGLGDRISGFFSNLGDRLSGFFTNLGTSIGGFFSDLKTNMSNWFSELGNKITTKFQEIGDKFTEFFEKFKPRVYINFDWIRAWINSEGKVYESNVHCVTSDLFYVNSDLNLNVKFVRGVFNVLYVVKYDSNGNFIKFEKTFYNTGDELALEQGFCYRFYLVGNQSNVLPDSELDQCNDYCLVYSDEGWINALFFNIKSFFSNLISGFGNLILYFNWDGDYTNPFECEDSPIDKVSEFFDDLIEYVDSIGTSIENILDSITGGLHIFDEFTSRFPWLKGIAMFCLAIIVLSRFIGL